MAQRAQSRNSGFFGFLTDKKVTYHRDVAKERKQRKAEAMADRKEKLALQKLRAEEKAAEAKIAAAEKKISAAKQTVQTASKKEKSGAISEAQFEAIKARMEKEIEAQERHKAAARNPARSAAQYRLAQAVLSGTARSSMPRKVAQEIVAKTPARLRSQYIKANCAKNPGGWKRIKTTYGVYKIKKEGTAWWVMAPDGGKYPYDTRAAAMKSLEKWMKPNPAEDAKALSAKFHGRKATTQKRIVEPMHVHKHLMEIGPLVRLVIDTPTGKVAVLNFNTSDPRKIVYLSSSEKDPKTRRIVGKQLYLRGGDQEVNLKQLGMDSALWIRDEMELGRLHEFKRGDPPLIVDGETVKGSITYRTRKGFDDFKLIDYWHKAGEETSRKMGPAARPIVKYDYRNKKIGFVGGQYFIDRPGIIN